MMDVGIDHLRADVDAKLADRKDSETISQYSQRKHHEGESASFPVRSQKNMPRHEARNEKSDT